MVLSYYAKALLLMTLSRILCYIVRSNPDAYQFALSVLAVVDTVLKCPALLCNIQGT